MHIPKKFRQKVDKKTEKCIFLGYATNAKGYRLWNSERRQITIRRDVIFNEKSVCPEGGGEHVIVDTSTDPEVAKAEEVPEEESEHSENEAESEDDDGAAEDVQPVDLLEDAAEEEIESEEEPVKQRPRRTERQMAGQEPKCFGNWFNYSVSTSPESQLKEPKTWKTAMQSEHAQNWKKATQSEYDSLQEHGVWELVALPPGKKLIGSRRVFHVKHDEYGQIEWFKAHFVAQGFMQVFGEDYLQIFAPVVR